MFIRLDTDCFQMASAKFAERFDESDISFSVEGKLIYAVKSTISMWSPVFKAMFCGRFKESKAKVVELPDKQFSDILELMCVLHPPNKPVDGKLVTFQTVVFSVIIIFRLFANFFSKKIQTCSFFTSDGRPHPGVFPPTTSGSRHACQHLATALLRTVCLLNVMQIEKVVICRCVLFNPLTKGHYTVHTHRTIDYVHQPCNKVIGECLCS